MPHRGQPARRLVPPLLAAALCAVVSCGPQRLSELEGTAFAPGVDRKGEAVDGVEVGDRLLAAGEYELALDAFTRAALDRGMTTEIVIGVGTANLGLGRLGQAEALLRRATREEPENPEPWNNLGIVLMEQGRRGEAEQLFRKAYALDNGESDSIRENLRLSLAKSENPVMTEPQNTGTYKLVRRGEADYLLRRNED